MTSFSFFFFLWWQEKWQVPNEETPSISHCLILLSLSCKVPLGRWGVPNQTMEEPIQEHQIMEVNLDHHLHQNAWIQIPFLAL